MHTSRIPSVEKTGGTSGSVDPRRRLNPTGQRNKKNKANKPNEQYSKMKKQVKFFVALLMSAGMLASQGLSAQKRVVKVQGHPHELLTQMAAQGAARTAVSAAPTDIAYIDPDKIRCWIDQPRIDPYSEIDSAYLMIKFTDGLALDSLFVWGYRWNPYQVYYHPDGTKDSSFVQHHGIDMLRTVVNNDERFSVMVQYTGTFGHAVGGIGLNWYMNGDDCSRVDLIFDLDGAKADPDVRFVYDQYASPDCADGQVATPTGAQNIANFATVDLLHIGFMEHLLGAEYGYPAYDYDYWNLYGSSTGRHWQAGWYRRGYWEYYRADNRRVPVPSTDPNNDPDASSLGITYEPLQKQQVHGFVFMPNFVVHYFNGEPVFVNCDCAPCAKERKGGSKR
jgi:hypothetical protein